MDNIGLVKIYQYKRGRFIDFIVEQYFKDNESLAATIRKFRTKYSGYINSVNSEESKFCKIGANWYPKYTGHPNFFLTF